MIDPEGIRRKAENLYPQFLGAWLGGEEFFPRRIPCNRRVDDNLAAAIASVQRLRAAAKETRGFGYTVEWQERNSRAHGKNLFPRRILIESQQDLLRFIGRERHFARFSAAVECVRNRFPVLNDWVRRHRQILVDVADEAEGLLEVVEYLATHPGPHPFARELPLSVDTKFVERNRRILREWLDLVLPPQLINSSEEHFERRFGLRYAEPLVFIRFLDDAERSVSSVPWECCAVPLHSLAASRMRPKRVVIVENKVNLLSLPPLKGALALGGLGNGASDLRYLPWLHEAEVWYWGDIDVEGFAILSRLRGLIPGVRSFLMDMATIEEWRNELASSGNDRAVAPPSNLTIAERRAFDTCLAANLRIEQERLPQMAVVSHWKRVESCQ